jgi:hypothetical protein
MAFEILSAKYTPGKPSVEFSIIACGKRSLLIKRYDLERKP